MSARRRVSEERKRIPQPKSLAAGTDVRTSPYKHRAPGSKPGTIQLAISFITLPTYDRADEIAYVGHSQSRWDFATFNDRERINIFAENEPYPIWYREEHIAKLFEQAGYVIVPENVQREIHRRHPVREPETVFTFSSGMTPVHA